MNADVTVLAPHASPRRPRATMATIPTPNATMAELAAESWRRMVMEAS